VDRTIVFCRPVAGGGTEVVVNFGPLTGREATIAEVDRLARRLCDAMEEVRVHAVRTHDVSRGGESIVHQVVVETGMASVEPEALRDVCEQWATDCADDRSLAPL
jgi:hypothetical protein